MLLAARGGTQGRLAAHLKELAVSGGNSEEAKSSFKIYPLKTQEKVLNITNH